MGFENELTQRLLRMTSAVDEPSDVDDLLHAVAQTARDNIAGAAGASITIRRPDDTLETLAATSEILRRLDVLQYELHEGPCFEAVTDERAVVSPHVGRDPRWPRFGPAAVALGFRSQMGVRMRQQHGAVHAINLYAAEAGAFREADDLLVLFASHAGTILDRAQQLESLGRALDSREEIGRAVGVIMERYGLDSHKAFGYLVRLSNESNTKLKDIAAGILEDRPEQVAGPG